MSNNELETNYDPEYAQGVTDIIAFIQGVWQKHFKHWYSDNPDFLSYIYEDILEGSPIKPIHEIKSAIRLSLREAHHLIVSSSDYNNIEFKTRIDHLNHLALTRDFTTQVTDRTGNTISVIESLFRGWDTGASFSLASHIIEDIYGREHFNGKASTIRLAQTALSRVDQTGEAYGIPRQNPTDSILTHPKARHFELITPGIYPYLDKDLLTAFGHGNAHGCLSLLPASNGIIEFAQKQGLDFSQPTIPMIDFYNDVGDIYNVVLKEWGIKIGKEERERMIDPHDLRLLNGEELYLPRNECIPGSIWGK